VPVLPTLTSDLEKARDALDRLPPPAGGSDWAQAVKAANDVLARSQRPRRDVILLSDGQRYGLPRFERHHRRKADSPSGTALALVADVAARRGTEGAVPLFGRGQGRTGPRPAGEIGMHSVRGGTWVGEHTVLLAGEGEWLELRHVAQDRQAFAHGALAAARFVAAAGPGFYGLEDVLAAGNRAQ